MGVNDIFAMSVYVHVCEIVYVILTQYFSIQDLNKKILQLSHITLMFYSSNATNIVCFSLS